MPTIYAIAGIPTAGKTTFRQKAVASGTLPANAFIHDCDAVLESLSGYQQQLAEEGPASAFRNWELPAREIAEQELQTQILAKRDIIYDRSCALDSSYNFLAELVNGHGYKLIMYLLFVEPQEALRRAIAREAQLNRHSPPAIITERWQKLRDLWPKYLQLASELYLLDNSAYQANLIAIHKDNELLIKDQNAYNQFIAAQNP